MTYIYFPFFILLLILLSFLIYNLSRKKKNTFRQMSEEYLKTILEKNIGFYKNLDEADKSSFLNRVNDFLNNIRITLVGDHLLTETDKVLLGSAAIIPIFKFPEWRYQNLREILIYENSFSMDFDPTNNEKNV